MFTEPNIHGGVINTIFALLFAVNLVAVLWALAMYFTELGSDHGKAEGKEFILNSVSCLWGLMIIYALVDWVRTAVGF